MSQTDKILRKLALQSSRVLKKIVGLKSQREMSNEEVEILLYNYSTQDFREQIPEEKLEKLHEALASLSEEEMVVIKGRYWEAKSLVVIANELGHYHDHKWTTRKLSDILGRLKDYLS